MVSFIKRSIFLLSYILNNNNDSKVIYYHDVSRKYTDMGTEFNMFQAHVDAIRRCGYKIVPNIKNRQHEAMICFDDGWRGIYDYKDFFVKQNITPTIFIAVDLIGKEGYLTERQIKELITMGFRFEGHTWSHKPLTLFDDKELKHELKDSKKELEKMFGHPFTSICYPQGRFSLHIRDLCRDYGYERQFSSLHGGYFDMEEKGLICRLCAQFSSTKELKWMLNGTSRIFRERLIKLHVKGSL